MKEIFSPYDDDSKDNETVAKNCLGDTDFKLICEAYGSGSHVPLLILSFIRKTIIENEPPINPIYGVDMDEQVSNLTVCLGGCERLLRTPIPVSIFDTNFVIDNFCTSSKPITAVFFSRRFYILSFLPK